MENLSRYELLRNKLKCDFPYLQTCCFCMPLRRGLLVFGFLKLFFACFLIVISFMPLTWMIAFPLLEKGFDLQVLLVVILSITALLSDLAFSVVVIVSAHMRNWKIMKACYYYMIGFLVMLTILFILYLFFYRKVISVKRNWLEHEVVISTIIFYFLQACLHFYLTILVRSAVYKFENDFNFRYVRNIDSEPVCVMED